MVGGHVELAGHVTVLHEGVVQPLTAARQQLGVVRLTVDPGNSSPEPGPEEAGVVRAAVHVPGQLPVPGHVTVQPATANPALALQLVQLGVGGGGEAAEAGEAPRGLLIEMDPRFWRGGDVLGHGNITRAAND